MNIGSKVRLLHGKEEGVITRISGKYVEVDLGEGFSIPVLSSEIVLISPLEARLETPSTAQPSGKAASPKTAQAFALKGIYLAFVPINDREVVLHLVNLTGWRLLFTIFGRRGETSAGLASGILEGSQSHQVTKLLSKDFETWPVFETSLLFYSDERTPADPVLRHSLRCRIQSFHKHLQKAPLLNVSAHVFRIDPDPAPDGKETAVPAEQIRDKMLGKTGEPAGSTFYPKRTPSRIDLHAEALPGAPGKMSGPEILELQLSAFKTYLEQSIAEGLEEVTIIHGVGQGTLRQEIHRQLSKHPNVAYYKDAQKEKFGYGATIAHLK